MIKGIGQVIVKEVLDCLKWLVIGWFVFAPLLGMAFNWFVAHWGYKQVDIIEFMFFFLK